MSCHNKHTSQILPREMNWKIFNTIKLINEQNLDAQREVNFCIFAIIITSYPFWVWIKDKRNLLIPITVTTCDLCCITNYIQSLETFQNITKLTLKIPNSYKSNICHTLTQAFCLNNSNRNTLNLHIALFNCQNARNTILNMNTGGGHLASYMNLRNEINVRLH